MATIILDLAASNTSTGTTELTPQDGDVYILNSDAIGEFEFLGDADFAGAEVESEMTDFVMQKDALESGASDQSARGRGIFVEGTA